MYLGYVRGCPVKVLGSVRLSDLILLQGLYAGSTLRVSMVPASSKSSAFAPQRPGISFLFTKTSTRQALEHQVAAAIEPVPLVEPRRQAVQGPAHVAC